MVLNLCTDIAMPVQDADGDSSMGGPRRMTTSSSAGYMGSDHTSVLLLHAFVMYIVARD